MTLNFVGQYCFEGSQKLYDTRLKVNISQLGNVIHDVRGRQGFTTSSKEVK
jgi:hypothetical protein